MAEYGTFSEVRNRLDEIVSEVRKKDLSLEKSLDLYEEAIKLGNRCAELVDKPDFSAEEIAAAAQVDEPEEDAQTAEPAQVEPDKAELDEAAVSGQDETVDEPSPSEE